MTWQPIETAPEDVEVMTRICDRDGERNVQPMTRRGRLWWINVGQPNAMYVYYAPTDWHPLTHQTGALTMGEGMAPFRLLDLFSGIGGFSLGLERSGGFKTVAFCEIDPFCRRVLRKHWPDVPQYEDVRTLTADRLAADGVSVDAICGGFPCQDISVAGKGAGLDGERSGLWSEYRRLVGELRPRVIVVENVAAILGRGLDRVLGDLAALGYDAEWHCIPASAVGAPHRRDRIWIVAYPNADLHAGELDRRGHRRATTPSAGGHPGEGQAPHRQWVRSEFGAGCATLADTDAGNVVWRGGAVQVGRLPLAREIALHGDTAGAQWTAEPPVGRVAHGVPNRVDRLGALGNAVVPQIPELIGRAIMEATNA